MSAGAQISWDEQSAAPPPSQISWDEEEKKQPEKKSFLSRAYEGVRNWMPEGIARRGLEKGSEWAGRKQEQSYDEGLKAAAHGEPAKSTAPGAGYGMMSSAMRYAASAIQPKPKDAAIMAGSVLAPEIVGPAMIAHGLHSGAKEVPAALKGNPEAAEKALLGGAEAAGGGAMTGSALAPKAPRTFTRNALSAANRTLVKGEPPNAMVPEAQKALTQAIQPGVNIPRAQESIGIAGPRMQQVRQATGVEVKNTQDALNLVRASKDVVHRAIEDRLGPVADLQPSTKPIADAMEKSISGRTERQFPGDAASIRKRADTYRGNLSLREIENSIQDANNELRNFYKRPGATDSPTSAHMDATLAEVKALRELLDDKVESLSGAGVKPLKREYGALRDVERATARQHAVATRTKEGGLWEGLAYLHAAGDLMSGNALGAAKAGGALTVGRMLKTLRDPNFLLRQSFHGPKAFEAAEPIAAHAGPSAPAGLLPAPPTEAGWTAPPDASGPVSAGERTPPFIHYEAVPKSFWQKALPAAREQSPVGGGGEGGGKSTYKPSEKAATMAEPAKNYGPEFNAQQAQEEINRNQAILRNPAATAEDRTVAESRLRDARENVANGGADLQ